MMENKTPNNSGWNKFKNWLGNTISLEYLKKLINGETNDDLKDFLALFLSFVLAGIVVYSVKECTTDGARLNIIIAVMSFVGSLTGLTTFKQMQTKYSDNRVKREIDVDKNKPNNEGDNK